MKYKSTSIKTFFLIFALLIGIGAPAQHGLTAPQAPTQPTLSSNLLKNGDMEDQPYYWKYPNHFVAPHWYRWWTKGRTIPEYDDSRSARPHYEGDHAQVYFKWGATYQAGIYQVVTGLTPCTPYRLSAWARNESLDDVHPHTRVGLDPEGTQLTPSVDDGDILNMPPKTAWSWEQTALFLWEELYVEAEPLNDRLTAILYASPLPVDLRTHYYDTFWDAATLITSTFSNDRLPNPSTWVSSDFIYDIVTTTSTSKFIVEWDTQGPASTQIWYDLQKPSSPITSSAMLSYTVYLPRLSNNIHPTAYKFTSELDITPKTHHRVEIPNLQSGVRVSFVILGRRPNNNSCVTEVYGPVHTIFYARQQ